MEEVRQDYWEYTGEIHPTNKSLKRVKLSKDCYHGKKGDIGGWVSNDLNLQGGWVFGYSEMHDCSRLYNNSSIQNNESMQSYGIICNSSNVRKYPSMYNNSQMYGDSKMHGNSQMYDNAQMFGNSQMHDNSVMHGNSQMYNNSRMLSNSQMHGNSRISGDSQMSDYSQMCGNSSMSGSSKMGDNSRMSNFGALREGRLGGTMELTGVSYYLSTIYPLTTSDNHIKCGCEIRTIKEWKEFLESDEVIETPRDTDKFRVIKRSLKAMIKLHKTINDV